MKRYVIDSYLVALAKHAYEYPLFWFCRNRSRMDSTWNGLEHTSKKNIDSESLGGGQGGEPLAKSLGQVTVFRCFLVQRLLSYDDPKSEPTVSLKLIH